jgi:UDP-N-acetylmuramate--alanine ligase
LKVPGRHNVANALAALAASSVADVPLRGAAAALAGFQGTRRRFETVGAAGGVTVIDDFAHNPDKITATLRTLHEKPGRVWAVFQPHGFGPTKLMRAGLVETFASELRSDDVLVMPEIYYAGGTAAKDISAKDIIGDVAGRGKKAEFIARRADIPAFLAANAGQGDRIIVMGARDDTLPAFAREILRALQK